MRLKLNNFGNVRTDDLYDLDESSIRSDDFYMDHVKCFVRVYHKKEDEFLQVFLEVGGNSLHIDMARPINATFKLLSTVQPITRNFNAELNWRSSKPVGAEDFIKWDDLRDPEKGFTMENNAVLEVIVGFGDPYKYAYHE